MSQKLENALSQLHNAVERLDKALQDNEKRMKSRAAQHQSDLFGSMHKPAATPQNNAPVQPQIDTRAMTAVLDRTISRVEKLVGEGR